MATAGMGAVRAALMAFPARFRAAFGPEMLDAYRDGLGVVGGGAAFRFTLITILDFLRSGLRERVRPTLRPVPPVSPGGPRRGGMLVDTLVRDFRHTVRSLARRPGFALVAIVTLALGIGANSAIFSVVDGVLLRALPYHNPDGLAVIWAYWGDHWDGDRNSMSQPDIEDIRALPAFRQVVGYRPSEATMISDGQPRIVRTGRVTEGLLAAFDLHPTLGRDVTLEDAKLGAPQVVVIGDRFWRERLGGRPDAIGAVLELSGQSYEVVGVAPAGFDFPHGAELWVPRQIDPESCGRGCHLHQVLGRLADGVTLEEAQSQANTLAGNLAVSYPETNFEKGFQVVGLADDLVGDVRTGLWFVLGAVGLVLLIACANVANLLLARAETRRGEVAIRAALGASRSRLAGQVLMESLVLSGGGVALGLVLAHLGLGLVRRIPAGTVPRMESVALDGRVLLFTIAVGLVVAVLFGLSPALSVARSPLSENLVAGRRGSAGPRTRRFRTFLLAGEVALSLLLLVGAGLLLKSFDRLYRVDMGFVPDRITRFTVNLPSGPYDTLANMSAFFRTLEDRLATLPGVEAVGSAYGPPLGRGSITGDVLVEGRPEPAPGEGYEASIHSVTPGYLTTMHIPLLRGRGIEPSDRAESEAVIVVSETFVRENFPGEDPLGKRVEVTANFGYGDGHWTIVGVVGDVRRSPTATPFADVYVPHAQFGPSYLTVSLRTHAGAAPSLSDVQSVVRTLDPALPVQSFETVSDAMRRQVAPTTFYLTTLGIFAGVAVILAAVGLYGVVAYLMAQRTREIGIRMALGARREQVVALVLGQGVRPAAIGLVVGAGLALVLARVAEGLLFQVSPRDPTVLVSVVILLGLVATGAAFFPARRASRVDPVKALRAE